MAKLVLNDITAGYGSNELYNANNDAIEDAIENTLSRDGATPNHMNADFDLNSHDILNGGNADFDVLSLGGTLVVPTDLAFTTLPDQTGNAGKFLTTNGSTPSWAAITQVHETVATMIADNSLAAGDLIQTKGYATAGDGGGAFYLIVTSGAFGGTPDELGDHTTVGTFVAVLQSSGIRLVEQYGATTAASDNTANIQAAIDKVADSDDASVSTKLQAPFTCTSPLTLSSGVTLKDINLTCDLGTNPDNFISAQGSLEGTSTTVAIDAPPGDQSIAVVSAAGFAAGDYILIKDPTRLSGRWPHTIARVLSVVVNTINLETRVGVEYLTANSCTVEKITPVVDAHVENVEIRFSATSTCKFVVEYDYAIDCSVQNVLVDKHAYPSNPTASVAIRADEVLNFVINEVNINQNINTPGGNAVLVFGSTDTNIVRVKSISCSFGVGLWMSYGAFITECQLNGVQLSGNRGIKVAGCQQIRFENNTINSFDSGIKVEDTAMFVINANTVTSSENGTPITATGINVSHQTAPSSADVRPSIISSNSIFDIDGIGINLDANSRFCSIDGNTIRQVTGRGILVQAPNCVVSNNYVYDWGSIGIEFESTSTVVGNQLLGLTGTNSLKLGNVPSDTDWTVVSNNVCQDTAADETDFDKLAVCSNNAILNLGNRVMFGAAAPLAGTFTRGDKMYHNGPSASGTVGWVCVAAGTPGTWKAFGTIAA